ncbi:MAG: sulfur oxidation c-type cytochrome SoxA [Granulosicoccaceae bacterium]|jgi:sulfur-oxidizing protein SoxA
MLKNIIIAMTAFGLVAGAQMTAQASPQDDLNKFRAYWKKKLPAGKTMDDYADGIYIYNQDMYDAWQAIEEFPPYELDITAGEELFNTPFKNGKTYASCFKNGGIGIAQNYPYWDAAAKKVKTLEAEINECRVKNGEKPLKWKKGKLAQISAYMKNTSRGKRINVVIPNDPDAIAAYEDGKQFYFARRGQLNFSCAHCHFDAAGKYIRANILSAGYGQATNFPVFRSKWGGLGTMHRRYGGCNKQVRAKPFKAQGPEYTNLEFFHTYMSNGMPLNAPSNRQ